MDIGGAICKFYGLQHTTKQTQTRDSPMYVSKADNTLDPINIEHMQPLSL
jgi:hypothetical protein